MNLQRPETLAEYAQLRAWLESLKQRNQVSAWGEAIRWYAQNDLFFLASEIISDGQHINGNTGERLYWDQFYIDWCRNIEWQLANGGGFDASARGSGKSTLRTKASNIQRMLNYPNSTGCIFSFQRKSSKKHFRTIKEELESNLILRTVFDDVLYWDPKVAAKNGETVWSLADGLSVKRSMQLKDQTLEYNAFFDGTPTGGRFDRMDFDDIEDHKAISNQEMLDKLHSTYDGTLPLLTSRILRPAVIMFTNTFYSDLGLAMRIWTQYKDEDPAKVRVQPAEDLMTPGTGPMGGSPCYPYTAESLDNTYKSMKDKNEYSVQYCCDFQAGAHRRLEERWLMNYPGHPDNWGRGRNIYICIDPSRGVHDPTAIWVWGLGADKKFAWVDGFVKKMDPALPEFYNEILLMYSKWSHLGKRVVEIRVENFGQATYASNIKKFFDDKNISVEVVSCADNMKTGKFNSGKRDREFERWAGPASQGDVSIPVPVSRGGPGIVRFGDDGMEDLVEHFLKFEWNKFPKPLTDNMLDAGSLIWEPEERTGRALQFPSMSVKKSIFGSRGIKRSAMSMG